MTDYEEEQQNELEALESIYPDSYTVLSEKPSTFTLTVVSEEGEQYGPTVDPLTVIIQFTYTPTYPEEAPLFEVDGEGLPNDSDTDEIVELINKLIEENLGMAMVFTIVSEVQEFINSKKDQMIQKIKDDAERKEREEKEAEERKCHGTPVTVASFLAWKMKFEYEMEQLQQAQIQSTKKNKKLTGREIFMQKDAEGDDSEILEGENVVEVDESLFEDLDDLEIDDDLDLDVDCAEALVT